jgi:hypothetical protein
MAVAAARKTLIEMTEGGQNRVLGRVGRPACRNPSRPVAGRCVCVAGPTKTLSNLPDRNPFFTRRKLVLAKVQDALAQQKRVHLADWEA